MSEVKGNRSAYDPIEGVELEGGPVSLVHIDLPDPDGDDVKSPNPEKEKFEREVLERINQREAAFDRPWEDD